MKHEQHFATWNLKRRKNLHLFLSSPGRISEAKCAHFSLRGFLLRACTGWHCAVVRPLLSLHVSECAAPALGTIRHCRQRQRHGHREKPVRYGRWASPNPRFPGRFSRQGNARVGSAAAQDCKKMRGLWMWLHLIGRSLDSSCRPRVSQPQAR